MVKKTKKQKLPAMKETGVSSLGQDQTQLSN